MLVMKASVARVLVLLALLALVACAAKPVLVPYDGPVLRAQRVFVATSRTPQSGAPPTFGGGRAAAVHFAEYDISIPPGRTPGDLRLPTDAPDPQRDFLAVGYQGYGSADAFVAAINQALDPLPPTERKVTLFVHGYNTGFALSVLRAAQLREDYRLGGPMVLFSWPSAEKPTHYVYDRDSVLFARDQFAQTLQALARSRATSITILAHSMGGLLTMEAVSRLRDRGDQRTLQKLKAIVLAEPDIDVDVFRTQVAGLDLRRLAVVVMASHRDRLLRLSRFVAGGHPRVGDASSIEALQRLGVIVVDVSNFDDAGLFGHSAFRKSPRLVALIRSGELARALDTARHGDNIVVGTLDALGTMALAVAYLPYELTP